MPKRRTERPISIPAPEILREIPDNIRAAPNLKEAIVTHLARLALDVKRAVDNDDHQLIEANRRRKKELKLFRKRLIALREVTDALDEGPLRHSLANELAQSFTNRAFNLAIGHRITIDVSARELGLRPDFHESSQYEFFEEHFARTREGAARTSGGAVMNGFLDRLIGQVDHYQRLNRDAGGAPQLPIRHFILNQLAPLHNTLARRHGETWTLAKFEELAEQVLAAYGQKTDGLSEAVSRFIARTTKK